MAGELTVEAEWWMANKWCLKNFQNSVFGVNAIAILINQREDMFT